MILIKNFYVTYWIRESIGKNNRDLSACHQFIGFIRVVEFKAVSDQGVGMDTPTNKVLNQLLHTPQRGDPAAVYRFLTVLFPGSTAPVIFLSMDFKPLFLLLL